MHDCRATESRLVDLVFDELGAEEKLSLLKEIEACADCLGDYRSMTGTLTAFDHVAEASLPEESYWPAHHAALRRRLEETETLAAPKRDSVWRRLFALRLPVPVPVAAVAVLALLITSVLALRSSSKEAAPAPQSQAATVAPQPKVIEVPVYRDRVVTRTVYVEKRAAERVDARRKSPTLPQSDATLTASNNETASAQGGFFTRANLTDFQPSNEMKIRIVKRNNSDEN